MKLLDLENIKLAPEHCVTGFGTTLIIAPHADDESLGCGGLIALLRKYNQKVYILLLSDGTLSHPNSKEYPAEKLMLLRENELKNAAGILNVDEQNILFSRFKDRSVPNNSDPHFEVAVKSIKKIIQQINPDSIFMPWRRDPHPDHRAANQLIVAADLKPIKIYEYPIWLQELGESSDSPTGTEVVPFRLDITSVLDRKQKAIAAHLSQTSDLITDDPSGFKLSEHMLNQFKVPYEIFYMST